MPFRMGNIFGSSGANPLGTQDGTATPSGSPVAGKVAARRWAMQNAKSPDEPLEPPPFLQLTAKNPEIFKGWREKAAGSVVFQENFLSPGSDNAAKPNDATAKPKEEAA